MKSLLLGFDAQGRPIELSEAEALTHKLVMGASGSGKSKLLEHLLRQHIRQRQGFALVDPHGTLYQDVVQFCGHYALERDIILLNVSEPDTIIGFNPFQRGPEGDVSVQVDRRITATMHAWAWLPRTRRRRWRARCA